MPKISPNKASFMREQKRLERIIRKELKSVPFVGEPFSAIPKMPKRITQKRLQEIQTMTRSELLARTETIDFETGQVIPYIVPKSRPRKVTSIKPLKSQRELSKIRSEAAQKGAKTKRERWAENLVDKYDIKDKDVSDTVDYLVDEYKEKGITREELKNSLDELLGAQEQEQTDEYDVTQFDNGSEPDYNDYGDYEKEPEPDYNDYGDYDNIPSDVSQPIEYIKAMSSYAENAACAKLITDVLNTAIEQEGYEQVSERISSAGADIMSLFDVVMYSSDQEEIFINMEAILDAITGDGFAYAYEIQEAMESDASNSGYYKYYR